MARPKLSLTLVLACAIVLLRGGMAPMRAEQSPPLALSIAVSGDHAYFKVDGVPKFLLFISYFDALRSYASSPTGFESDLQQIKARGFHGIRIFPNWWNYECRPLINGGPTREPQVPVTDALFTNPPNNQLLDPTRLQQLKSVLDAAKTAELLVNVTFTLETVADMDYNAFKARMVQITLELDDTRPHVYFDIQNEYDSATPTQLDASKIATIAGEMRNVDLSRILTVSTGAGSEFLAGQTARTALLDVASPHDDRVATWYNDVSTNVTETRNGMDPSKLPIVFEEPKPISQHPFGYNTPCGDFDANPDNHRTAAANAKKAGAAAWTLHSRMSFQMTGVRYIDRVSQDGNEGENKILGIGTYSNEESIFARTEKKGWLIAPGFQDDPATVGTPVRPIHILELRARIDLQLSRFSKPAVTWSAAPEVGTNVKAVHFTELQSALSDMAAQSCDGWVTFDSIMQFQTVIRAAHIEQIRANLRKLEVSDIPCMP